MDDSGVEKPHAAEPSRSGRVRVFARPPEKFKVPTPPGRHSPDRVYVEEGRDGGRRASFVTETKGADRGGNRPRAGGQDRLRR